MADDHGLRRLALGTLLAAFPGETAPAWAIGLLAEGLAGHTLFGTNIGSPEQVAALTAALREGRPDAVIAIDEEGGDVTRLAHRTGSPYPGNAALGVVDDVPLTSRVYAAIGRDLVAAGINLDLAPDVDVNTVDNPVIGTRSFGAPAELVARHAGAAVTGLQSVGVAACAKHFPGHGATVADSHLSLPTVDVPLAVLRERDLPPFAAAVAAGARAVMTAHVRVPVLTGDDPATFSAAALGLLRGELGFRGVIVTDGLEMKGTTTDVPRGAVRALAAGADLLCLGARVDAALVEAVVAEIVTALGDGRLSPEKLSAGVTRTTELARWSATPGTRRSPDARLGMAVARRAVRVEGSLAEVSSPLVVRVAGEHTIAEGRVPWGLRPHLDGIEQVDVAAAAASVPGLVSRAGGRPIVVVGRQLHRFGRDLVERLAAAHPVVVVEMGRPSSWRPAGCRAFVATHGASLANGRAAAEVLGLTAPAAFGD